MKVSQFPVTSIITLLVSKIMGIVFASLVFGYSHKDIGLISLFKPIELEQGKRMVMIILSSYSDLFMFTILSVVMLVTLMMHSKKTKNFLTKADIDKYLNKGFKSMIKIGYKLYGNSLYWVVAIWISNLYILFNTLTGKTYVWIYLMVLILSVSLTLYSYYDLKREIELSKNKILNNEI